MRYLLVAVDKSSKLPIEIPSEIVAHTRVSKLKSTVLKSSQKIKRLSEAKQKSTLVKSSQKVKKRLSKANNRVSNKHKQISRPIAK